MSEICNAFRKLCGIARKSNKLRIEERTIPVFSDPRPPYVPSNVSGGVSSPQQKNDCLGFVFLLRVNECLLLKKGKRNS